MELVFALITYLGAQKLDTSYFRSIDDCMYFAKRINKNVGVPNLVDDGGKTPMSRHYKAVCEPRKINTKREKVY
tara:strand:- start:2659 stop:2880 length:222 start_codon:yes stop_codon:yes gene_type:complete